MLHQLDLFEVKLTTAMKVVYKFLRDNPVHANTPNNVFVGEFWRRFHGFTTVIEVENRGVDCETLIRMRRHLKRKGLISNENQEYIENAEERYRKAFSPNWEELLDRVEDSSTDMRISKDEIQRRDIPV